MYVVGAEGAQLGAVLCVCVPVGVRACVRACVYVFGWVGVTHLQPSAPPPSLAG